MERHFSLPKAPQPDHEEKVRRVLELLTLDLKVLGLGCQGHEVTGGVDGSTEALQPSSLGSGREVRLGNRALQQVVQVLRHLIVCVRWNRRKKSLSHWAPGHSRSPAATPEGQSFTGCKEQQRGASTVSQPNRQRQQQRRPSEQSAFGLPQHSKSLTLTWLQDGSKTGQVL